ncbi:hypothetical protein OJF2_23950 [Aquisphaera giovannonii]|uniref:DUF4058 family protein n=1 Tax=Aquisphaera giovannonii TaxID=406548 RepID=A0A5B9W0W8_9BACT|nr:DUF4058 family protein [Aquisphaera giovannonii]QEH33864.1 hypothetical protein OJF2_23950 [Aquisphaera giovannonii]
MPIHDWTLVDARLFHTFHQHWITRLCDALNDDRLPPEFFALSEQSIVRPIPDALTLGMHAEPEGPERPSAAMAVASAPPRARLVSRIEQQVYARKVDRVAIRHRHGQVVSVIEIVSPGNKSGRSALRTFVEKSADLIERGVHVLVVDLFPPTRRDPQGIHKAI